MNRGSGDAVLHWGIRSESRDLSNPRPLPDFVSSVCRNVVKLLRQTAGPTDFELFYCGINSQAEMEPRIAARVVTPASMHFVNLSHARRGHGNPSADRCAVALRSSQSKQDAVVRVLGLVQK